MEFRINEEELREKAKSSCEIASGEITPDQEEFWYNFALNHELAKAIAEKTDMDRYDYRFQEVKEIPRQYVGLVVDFINEKDLQFEGKYWSFQRLYREVEDWQIERLGKWTMFYKVLMLFHRAEEEVKDVSLSEKEIESTLFHLFGTVQTIGATM